MESDPCGGEKCSTIYRIYVNGSTLCEHNNLEILFPKIAKQWNYELNKGIPKDYLPGSCVKVWWKCENVNCGCKTWQTLIQSRTRTSKDTGCYCCNDKSRVLCAHNNLTVTHPELLKEWDYDKNDKLPSQYTHGSNVKVFWKCPKNNCGCHIYDMSIHDRTTKRVAGTNRGCPFCSGKRTCVHNNAFTQNLNISKEWDYTKNIKSPNDYVPFSHAEVFLICPKDKSHQWKTNLITRNNGYSACPECQIANYNLLTEFPHLKEEWDYGMNDMLPETFSPHSAKKAWWRCKKNNEHSWEAAIQSRTNERATGCPICFTHGYSKMQIKWLNNISEKENINIIHAENEGEYYITDVGKVDGYCKETNTVYEFHGDFYHGNPIKYNREDVNDKLSKTYGELYDKTLARDFLIISKGYKLITMWEHDFRKLSKLNTLNTTEPQISEEKESINKKQLIVAYPVKIETKPIKKTRFVVVDDKT